MAIPMVAHLSQKGRTMTLQDLTTAYYIAAGISLFLVLFFLVAAVRIIWLLQDIRMELRSMNDSN
jgi:hypothetical protein